MKNFLKNTFVEIRYGFKSTDITEIIGSLFLTFCVFITFTAVAGILYIFVKNPVVCLLMLLCIAIPVIFIIAIFMVIGYGIKFLNEINKIEDDSDDNTREEI